jgi:two-component system cell cycle sensor histidine kinase/response regulator CckA
MSLAMSTSPTLEYSSRANPITGRHVLLVDDDVRQLKLSRAYLEDAGYSVSTASCASEALNAARETRPDAIVSDVIMGELDGFALCSLFRCDSELGAIPLILVSAHVDARDHDVALATGARALVQRSPEFDVELRALADVMASPTAGGGDVEPRPHRSVSRMANQMAQLLVRSRTAEDRYQSLFENASESEEKYRALVENIPDVVWAATPLGRVTFMSPNVAKICGFRADEIVAAAESFWFSRIHPDDVSGVREAYDAIAKGGYRAEYRWQHKDGHWIWIRSHAAMRVCDDGQRLAEGTFADITEYKGLEEQLRQAQKMEAVGQLTGGIAHDFNNILTVILGNGELLRDTVPAGDPRRADVETMLDAGRRAAGLTRQLLAFSRRQILEPRILDLGEIVRGIEKMLRRLIGEDVALSISTPDNLGRVKADPGQIEQVLMNLVVNARDAMPRGGKLSIETANVAVDRRSAISYAIQPGEYVRLAVSDSGCGMNEETKRRLFEPFFTTKDIGRGTGLGLSTCYGIVRQSNGAIDVVSRPGEGSVFTVYLPVATDDAPAVERRATPSAVQTGSETILVIEDNAPLRTLVSRVLSGRGYRLLEARDGEEAIALSTAHDGPIDLVLSDVVIPGLSGPDSVSRIFDHRTDTKALFMSGYTDHAVLRDHSLHASVNFIQKPFVPAAIARKVREVLDAIV